MQHADDIHLGSTNDDSKTVLGNCSRHADEKNRTITSNSTTASSKRPHNITDEGVRKIADITRSGNNITVVCPDWVNTTNATNSTDSATISEVQKSAVKTSSNKTKKETATLSKETVKSAKPKAVALA